MTDNLETQPLIERLEKAHHATAGETHRQAIREAAATLERVEREHAMVERERAQDAAG